MVPKSCAICNRSNHNTADCHFNTYGQRRVSATPNTQCDFCGRFSHPSHQCRAPFSRCGVAGKHKSHFCPNPRNQFRTPTNSQAPHPRHQVRPPINRQAPPSEKHFNHNDKINQNSQRNQSQNFGFSTNTNSKKIFHRPNINVKEIEDEF